MTITVQRGFFALAGLLIIALLSSCGGSAASGSSSSTTAAPAAATATPASSSSNDYGSGGKDYGSAASTPTANTTNTSNVVVKTTSVMVSGKSMTILTDAKGMTLYYYKPDTASKTACTGGCAQAWPPLLFSSGSKPGVSGSLPGELEVYPNANGKQVIYNDHPLYTYSGDSAAGQATGQGVGGVWFVATPDLAKNA